MYRKQSPHLKTGVYKMNIERIDLSRDAIDYLASMQTTAPLAAEEALSKAGATIQKSAVVNMRAMRHNWIKYLNKKGKITTMLSKSQTKQLGAMQSNSTAAFLGNDLADMIKFRVYPNHQLLVVGGRHRRFTPKRIKDGVFKGYMKNVKGVDKGSFALLEKMERGIETTDYKKYFPREKKPRLTRWGFFQKAKSDTKSEVDNIMQKQLLIMLEKGVANAQKEGLKRVV